MTASRVARRDLVLLVADADMREGFAALLARHHALGIRPITFDVFRHGDRDPGCYTRAHEYLRPLVHRYGHALVVFDRHGCGSSAPASVIETEVRQRTEQGGWPDRCEVVVLDPELEVWAWSPSPKVAECLGWPPDAPPLRQWLEREGLWGHGAPKPAYPKAAVERVRTKVGKRRSPKLYGLLGSAVTTRGCTDPSFSRLREILQRWFPPH